MVFLFLRIWGSRDLLKWNICVNSIPLQGFPISPEIQEEMDSVYCVQTPRKGNFDLDLPTDSYTRFPFKLW